MNNILVTGGAGFFGQAFVRAALSRGAERVCVFSRSESSQAQMRAEFNSERLRFFIGDVRDKDRLRRAMHGIDLVVHAAALKRIEAAEYNVMEAVQTNVLGTQNVVSAAIDAGVKKAILLSTDKACNPTTTYGKTKALAEDIFFGAKHYAGADGPKFAVCRYGNVTGSTGSVVPTWRRMSGPVQVTDPNATRFFMRASEAVQLVWNTALAMDGGELIIPEWLPAYSVGDLAEAMGKSYVVTGLAPNEKLHEEMRPGLSSDKARRMTAEELREELAPCLTPTP
jgi:UDP-N-acetylglucosamine 4,6-dehydratase